MYAKALRRCIFRKSFTCRLSVQRLEDRSVPTTFAVANLNDSGAGSLRQAILSANGATGADTIDFQPGLSGTIGLNVGNLPITDAVTINGPGSNLITVSAGGKSFNVIDTSYAPANTAISISGLSITGGNTNYVGGGIFIDDEQVTLTNCVIAGNAAKYSGGGIAIRNASVTLNNCIVSGNNTKNFGPGIDVHGDDFTVSINNCSITGNTTLHGHGGGISIYSGSFYSSAGNANVQITNTLVSGNKASGLAGGIWMSNSYDGALNCNIRNTTVAGNSSGLAGGGLGLNGSGLNVNLQNSTIGGNTAVSGKGGGVCVYGSTLYIESTIISGNSAPTAPELSNDGTSTVDANYSAISSNQGFTLASQWQNLAFSANLKLGPLSNNGGPTLTMLPAAGSPLIDAGSNPANLLTDQRGFSRVGHGAVDIGAAEFSYVVQNAKDNGVGSLRQAILDANGNAGVDTIVFNSAVFSTFQAILLTTGELSITDPVTIVGPGADLLTISASNLSRAFNVTGAPTGIPINLSGVWMTNGKSPNNGGAFLIGNESVTLTDCVLANNSAGQGGGALSIADGGSLTLRRCEVRGNIGSGTAAGGGIQFLSGGSFVLDTSTVAANSTNLNGGGIFFGGSIGAGGFVVQNSTISSNYASGSGGGICLFSTGTLLVQNSTIANNSAASGGGIYRNSGATTTITSSIIAGNTASTGPDINSPGVVNVNSSALGSAAGFTATGGNNIPAGTNLKLGQLDNNGGPTLTHLPAIDSPLINAGSNTIGLNYDQRGYGFVRVDAGTADIGAVEYIVGNLTATINQAATQADPVNAGPILFDVVFNAPVSNFIAADIQFGGTAGASSVTISGSGTLYTVSLSGMTQTGTVTASIPAGKVSFGSLTNTASTSTDNSVTYDIAAPVAVVSTTAANPTNVSTIPFTITFAEPVTGLVATDVLTINASVINFSGSGANYTCDVIPTAQGGFSVWVSNATCTDLAGNKCLKSNVVTYKYDSVAPVPTASLPNVTSVGGTNVTFTVTFTDPTTGVVVDSINDDGLIRITGPNGFDVPAKFVSIDNPANGTPRTVTVQITPPGGVWGPEDNGTYAATLQGGKAKDLAENYCNQTVLDSFDVNIFAKVSSVQVNDNSAQRSRVTSLAVTFDQPPLLPAIAAAAFHLQRQSDSAAVSLAANVTGNVVTLTFVGGAVNGGSLADGRYSLSVLASQISNLDGNGDGTAGDDYQLIGDPATNKLFRLYGDSDGNGIVNQTDFIAFRNAFNNGPSSIFDFEGDGNVTQSDFIQFRNRFNLTP